MKKWLLGNASKYLNFVSTYRLDIYQSQQILAWQDSQKFIYKNSCRATRLFEDHWMLRDYVLELCPSSGLLLEFGVYKGKSINHFARHFQKEQDNRMVYGFDSFQGFSEEWTGVEKRYGVSHFDLQGGERVVEENVKLIDGYIENTLPQFCAETDETVAFIHIDTDTYSPAKTVLNLLKHRFKKGTIILFDELTGYPNWRSHEYAALIEELSPKDYEFIGFATNGPKADLIKAAIRIRRDMK